NVAALREDDLAGTGERVPHVPGECRGDEAVVLPPDEQGGGPQLAEPRPHAALAVRRVEVDVSRRGEEGDPGRAGAVGATELVRGDVGRGWVEPLRAGEQAPEAASDLVRPQGVGDQGKLGA